MTDDSAKGVSWKDLFRKGSAREIAKIAVSAAGLVPGFFGVTIAGIDLSWIAILLCGTPILIEAATGLITRFDVKADLLVSLALIASVLIGEYFAAGEVAVIMALGGLLEEATAEKARRGIERLAKLSPDDACVVENGREERMPAAQVRKGATVRVRPGETVPVDGVILAGETSVDESVLTGEVMPADKRPGDRVLSGSVNRYGVFELEAQGVGEASTLARMVKLVESADASRAKIVRLADRWATWIVAAALAAAAVTWGVTGEIIRAVTILVVFCPCALVLATPTAVMAAIGRASASGVLVRDGGAMERLAEAERAAFDKTGTLTTGEPWVSAVIPADGLTREKLLELAAAAELPSEHPLGRAVLRTWREEHAADPEAPESFEMESGSGVRAVLRSGSIVRAGRLEWLENRGLAISEAHSENAARLRGEGATVIGIEADGVLAGIIALSDHLREGVAGAVEELKRLEVYPMLMTGDHRAAAEHAAKAVGIDLVEAECLPEDKLRRIEALERATVRTAMVGDGINDAPALRRAWVGIAMGGIGSDIALSAADIVLVRDDIRVLPWVIRLSRRMMRMIRFNLSLAMLINFAAIILAAGGLLGPVLGALVHNAGSVLVTLNSARLLKAR